MAAASTVRGRLVLYKLRRWGSFTDGAGKTVDPGEGFTVWVYTPHDNDLCEIVSTREEDPQRLAKEFDALGVKFGDEIEVSTGNLSNRKYRGVFGVAKPAKS